MRIAARQARSLDAGQRLEALEQGLMEAAGRSGRISTRRGRRRRVITSSARSGVLVMALSMLRKRNAVATSKAKLTADLRGQTLDATRDAFADIHYAEPGRALALAKAVGVLPAAVYLVGCAPAGCALGDGLSAAVAAALDEAEQALWDLLARLGNGPVTP